VVRRTAVHRTLEALTKGFLLAFWNFRTEGLGNVPVRGGTILACMHQSLLDPPLIRVSLKRPTGFVARSTLFRSRLFAAAIRYLGALSFDREGVGSKGMREVLEVLRGGDALILFPEGTRSRDGGIGALKPGVALLARRSGVPVVPVGIAGTFECWPRHRKLPRPGRVRIVYGEPVTYGERQGRGEILEDLKNRLTGLAERARSMA
jgi:1-acyl-sn-glycerol-3-phosphate acyltransferase